MKKLLAIGGLISIFVSPTRSIACSTVGCLGSGFEVRSSFVVRVTHDDGPLRGVGVRVTRFSGDTEEDVFSGVTPGDGKVHINLPPGDYWLHVNLLGISAADGCFHVSHHPSWKAKGKLVYEWGEEAWGFQQAGGTFVDFQPAQGGSRLWNSMHATKVPVANAKFRLQDPLSGAVYTAVSGAGGEFSFGQVRDGVYVLHLEGASLPSGRSYEAADMLFRVTKSAKSRTLLLVHRDADYGSCGGTGLESASPAS